MTADIYGSPSKTPEKKRFCSRGNKIMLILFIVASFATICFMPVAGSLESDAPTFNVGPLVMYNGMPYLYIHSFRASD